MIASERDDSIPFLRTIGCTIIPSVTNFVFASHPSMKGEDVYRKIKSQGILVRHFNTAGIENYVRITIGTSEQMQLLKNVIDRMS